jgi:hypothetical protein
MRLFTIIVETKNPANAGFLTTHSKTYLMPFAALNFRR